MLRRLVYYFEGTYTCQTLQIRTNVVGKSAPKFQSVVNGPTFKLLSSDAASVIAELCKNVRVQTDLSGSLDNVVKVIKGKFVF